MKIQSCNIKTDNYPNKSLHKYLEQFNLNSESELFQTEVAKKTVAEKLLISNCIVSVFINEFWTAQQRQSNSIHEISYRACFKAQLPRFFIDLLTDEEDLVYDPFSGRGTTIIEAALMNRNVISNDINPLSKILTEPRLNIPSINDVKKRLES
ncbi:TPA: hypothetical protein DCW38_04850, partial [candidate division WOR-3 bacterium]|nr:hypothetical protein [candidate division WOR-3 bacterium]